MNTNNETLIQKDVHRVNTRWGGKMYFESLVNDHFINMDKLPEYGGEGKGPRPKPLILSAIAGCTGMEIVSILEKMRLKIESLEIDVTGELNDELPKIYKSVHIVCKVKGQNDDKQKIERAIQLATEKYCGVLAMVRHFAAVTSEIKFL
ncbi:MAG TPA: OsmC family protein [Bacteroidia bacterium]|nr:OsmC family protein [Bacteroidia bacterium]